MTSKVWVLFLIGIALSGCATRGLAPRDLEALKNSAGLTTVRYAEVEVEFDSAARKVPAGLIGAGIAAAAGTSILNDRKMTGSIITEHSLPDPGALIESSLRTALREKAGISNLSTQPLVRSLNSTAGGTGGSTSGDYELELRPVELTISEHVLRKPRFEVLLIGRATLKQTRDDKKIWSAICTFFEWDDKRMLFDRDPLADNAAILREVIPIAAEGCARKLETSLLGR